MQSFQIPSYGDTETVVTKPEAAHINLSYASVSSRPTLVPGRKNRKSHWLVKTNHALRSVLIALCGITILGYGLDVASSSNVSKLEDKARRLSEQNTELSAQLLKVISFQGIQDSVLGQSGLSVPEQVLIVKEVSPDSLVPFQQHKYHLPLIAGY